MGHPLPQRESALAPVLQPPLANLYNRRAIYNPKKIFSFSTEVVGAALATCVAK